MITPWYYDYYEKGKFPNQQILCERVAWTHSIEGQKRITSTSISAPIANSLTLRLRALSKALDKLKREVNRINNAIQKIANVELDENKSFSLYGKFHSQDSHLKTEGAPAEELEIGTFHKLRHVIYHKHIHNALFDYFTNLGSVLDRAAYEVNHFYQLGDWIKDQIDWTKLTNPNNKLKLLDKLVIKNPELSKYIREQSIYFKDINGYRNRLIHDAVLNTKIDSEGFPRKFYIYLPNNPSIPNSKNNKDAVEYCNSLKKSVLKLLNGIYYQILANIESNGKPPW